MSSKNYIFKRSGYFVSIVIILGLAWLSLGPAMWGGDARDALAASDPVIAAAGDIACDPLAASYNAGNGSAGACRQKATSDLLVNAGLKAILSLGDNQYACGGYQAYQKVYDPTWGRVKSITRPVVGNHEYLTTGGTDCTSANAGAAGYFKYFGSAAGDPTKGYYSYDIGTWHLIALNSNCSNVGGCSASSPQGKWLAADLAAHPNFCTLAYWHIPLFSSGGRAAANTQPIWQILYDHDVDVVLNGHDHIYERFAPQTPSGVADAARGIREFIVGSGGSNHTSLATVAANSQVRNTTTYGVLKLTLHATTYDWKFVPEAGKTFSDSGTGKCHQGATTALMAVADVVTPTAPAATNVNAPLAGDPSGAVPADSNTMLTVTPTPDSSQALLPTSTGDSAPTATDTEAPPVPTDTPTPTP